MNTGEEYTHRLRLGGQPGSYEGHYTGYFQREEEPKCKTCNDEGPKEDKPCPDCGHQRF